ncbi:SDR family NAD(P)-dependent oxidoreductase [Kitasatospora cineracea]|uniref:NAD(P)-dependent dehydrogenase (Short-subunit alcohol dehydrogenase family) n=1 Tax=Kitasatospora cineracea TaxID=88074 RepID=A0A8G1UMA6_9ACTN|nr:SDR family oxidoreductase [Kitasatospora cineracea]ROR46425.1 NAD(P)-dependent dehydrogenase (short-subunit alcohol dehydrogenase family) [Kitasatospora cineracea]
MTRTALITGAAGGIGSAVAARLLADGWQVAGLDLVGTGPAGVRMHHADATDPAGVRAAVAAARAELGRLDALVTCAGLTEGAPLHETTDEQWHRVLDANLTSVFHCVREVLPAMLEAGSGTVVTVGSVLHRTAAPGLPAYAAAKGAIAALTRQLAVDYGRYGLTFLTLSPGWVRTPATESRLGPHAERDLARLRESNPLRTVPDAERFADAVALALSPAAALLTGSELVLDAGARLVSPASLLRDAHRERLGLPPLDA